MKIPASFSAEMLAVARREIGVLEVGDNGGERICAYQAATWLDPGSWPWCAAFVCWCFLQSARAIAPNLLPARPQTPRAFGFESWAVLNGLPVKLPKPENLIPGNIVIFQFPSGGHVGIVSSPLSSPYFGTIEGNTNLAGDREGDGVFCRNRSLANVRSVILFPSKK